MRKESSGLILFPGYLIELFGNPTSKFCFEHNNRCMLGMSSKSAKKVKKVGLSRCKNLTKFCLFCKLLFCSTLCLKWLGFLS